MNRQHPPSSPVQAYIGAGSNLEPAHHLRLALRELRGRFGPLLLSSLYRNRAEGFEGPDFLNMVVGLTTAEPPAAVNAEIERLHALAGRVRGENAFSSRTLDLDLLLYGDLVDEALRLPRADVTRYGFVLGPLAELAPGLRHPVSGQTMAALWSRFDQARHPLERLPLSVLDVEAREFQ